MSRIWQLLDGLSDNISILFAIRSRGFNVYERPNVDLSSSAILVKEEHIIIEPRAVIGEAVVLDATKGPIIIQSDVVVEHRSVIIGPTYIGHGSVVKVGSNIRNSAIGPVSKVAGEVHTSVLHSHSNKAHDGFLGHSILGEWCNLGAATNNSNLKNDYGVVTLYNESLNNFESTGRQFMGLVMGDHSKSGIATMFNTGTVVGVSCNVFGNGYQPRFIPSFSWGGQQDGFSEYRLDKAVAVARAVARRRAVELSDAELELLQYVSETTSEQRITGSVS